MNTYKIGGAFKNARARATRCFSPPLNWKGKSPDHQKFKSLVKSIHRKIISLQSRNFCQKVKHVKNIWFKNPNYLRLWSYETATLNKTGKKNLKTHYEFRIQKNGKKEQTLI